MKVMRCRPGKYQETCLEVSNFVYAGRKCAGYPQSMFGNPYRLEDYPLNESIRLYRVWLASRPDVLAAVKAMSPDSVLGCWCIDDPEPLTSTPRGEEKCHCQVLTKAWKYLCM